MSHDSDSSDSRGRSRSRSPLRQQRDPDAKIRLARIFISQANGVDYEWDGTAPNLGDKLFVYYVIVSDKTYRDNIFGSDDKSTFDHFHDKKDNVTISYLYSPNIMKKPPPLHFHTDAFTSREKNRQASLLPSLMSKGRIFQNDKNNSCWYELSNFDVYSDEYEYNKDKYDFFDVMVIDVHEEFNKEYRPLQTYVPTNVDRRVLFRETGLHGDCFRCTFKQTPRQRSRTPPRGGGGKTRRKFKVKKRRNRRIRNTMKRRKTAVKRRNGRK
jgi:hypothetical protein